MELNQLTIKQAHEGLKKKEFTSVELTEACLYRIKERNGEINAFITVCEKEAIEEAKKADAMIAKNEMSFLTGIPYSVKDAICTKDVRSTGAAKILDNYTPSFDATVIKKIREQIGRASCRERVSSPV